MNNTFTKLQEEFNQECKVINLQYEYQGYIGDEKWAIITELSENELFAKYEDIITPFIPFVLLSLSQGEIINDFNRNEDKFRKRSQLYGHNFDINDGEFELHHPEFAVDSFESEVVENEKNKKVRAAIMQLKPIQKRRLIKHFYKGMSSREIAKEEGVNYSAVDKSIAAAINNLKNILK